MKIEFTIPLTKNLIVSEGNRSWEHWSKKSKRHKSQHFLIECFMNQQPDVILPCLITLTRIAPRMLDEDDNVIRPNYNGNQLTPFLINVEQKHGVQNNSSLHNRYILSVGFFTKKFDYKFMYEWFTKCNLI